MRWGPNLILSRGKQHVGVKKKPVNYLNNENLLREISESKIIQEKYPNKTPAECLTPNLVNMLITLVNRYSQKFNWRGYSYIDDMKGDALASLCQNALKFKPEKSNNPFGYYTQIITHCFLTYLDKEKTQRLIRDEFIEISGTGMKPSLARQLEDEYQRFNEESEKTAEAPKKPGD